MSLRNFLSAAVSVLLLSTSVAFAARGNGEVIPPRRNALIFKGPSICAGCEKPWANLLAARGFKVRYVRPGETTPGLLKTAFVYVVPGGEDVKKLSEAWSGAEREALRAYVIAGGRYVGACLGAYWAADWPGEIAGFEPLRLTNVHVAAHDPDKADKIVKVDWEGRFRFVYFQDGPSFSIPQKALGSIHVFARYEDASVAAFVARVGLGRVALTGVHVEATEDWYQETGLKDPDGLDTDLANEFLGAALSE